MHQDDTRKYNKVTKHSIRYDSVREEEDKGGSLVSLCDLVPARDHTGT